MKKPNLTGVICLLSGAGVVVATVLRITGVISLGYVSQREAGVDIVINQTRVLGPFVLLCWGMMFFGRPKHLLAAWAVVITMVWFFGMVPSVRIF